MAGDSSALILAAGRGVRMGQAKGERNKCLVEIGGKPLLVRTVSALRSRGVDDIIVITGFDRSGVEHALSGLARCVFNPDFASTGPLGSASCAAGMLRGRQFIFTPGDQYFDANLIDLFEGVQGDILVLIERKECDDEDVKAVIRSGKVFFGKDIPSSDAVGELTGLMMFTAAGSERFFSAIMQDRKSCYVFDHINALQEAGLKVTPVFCEAGRRIEIDFPHDLARARGMRL